MCVAQKKAAEEPEKEAKERHEKAWQGTPRTPTRTRTRIPIPIPIPVQLCSDHIAFSQANAPALSMLSLFCTFTSHTRSSNKKKSHFDKSIHILLVLIFIFFTPPIQFRSCAPLM